MSAPLLTRLQALEKLVHGLLLTSGAPAETLQPNYLTVNKQGQVGADFTGLINALGLIIPAASGPSPGAVNRIQWQDTSNSDDVADLAGVSFTGTRQLVATAHALLPADNVTLFLLAQDSTQATQAFVSVNEANNGATAEVRAGAGGHQDIAINAAGQSSYVRGADDSAGQLRIACGTATVTWPGGNPVSSPTLITGVPFQSFVGCVATPNTPNNGLFLMSAAANYAGGNPAQFNIYGISSTGASPGAGTTQIIYWLAFSF